MIQPMASKPPSIQSFSHQCHPRSKLLVFRLPVVCPLCGRGVDAASVPSPVAQCPSPFVSASCVPFSAVIKPTVGDFLHDYGQDDNLHIGITSSRGSVYSYDETGVTQDTSGWCQCLAVPLLEEYDDDMKMDWNRRLADSTNDPQWQSERYEGDGHNCFDFVVGFLNAIGYSRTKDDRSGPITRDSFCRDVILPVTSRAAGYIGIHRSIAKYGVLVQQASTSL